MDDANEVTELTGTEGGQWRVWTRGSSHLLDLDTMTVERIPGPGRPATFNDRPRPIRTLEVCAVGLSGRWTMLSDDASTEFFWHITSPIRLIERITIRSRLATMRPIAYLPSLTGDETAPLTGEEPWLTTEDQLHNLDTATQSPNAPADES